jgi:hypothetical protein
MAIMKLLTVVDTVAGDFLGLKPKLMNERDKIHWLQFD